MRCLLGAEIKGIEQLRKQLKREGTKSMKVKHLDYIAKCYKCRMIIYYDKLLAGKPAKFVTKGNKEWPLIELVLHNNHYSVFDGFREDVEKDKELKESSTILRKVYIFYDMETYFDRKTHNNSLLVGYC